MKYLLASIFALAGTVVVLEFTPKHRRQKRQYRMLCAFFQEICQSQLIVQNFSLLETGGEILVHVKDGPIEIMCEGSGTVFTYRPGDSPLDGCVAFTINGTTLEVIRTGETVKITEHEASSDPMQVTGFAGSTRILVAGTEDHRMVDWIFERIQRAANKALAVT